MVVKLKQIKTTGHVWSFIVQIWDIYKLFGLMAYQPLVDI